MKSVASFVAFAFILVGSTAGTAPTQTVGASFVPGPCPSTPQAIPELKHARCGRLTVPENRHHPMRP